jgi:uncharacterized protein (DUF488 family)
MWLFTIGYEGRHLADVTCALAAHGIDVVLDVRERAWSRKPGFSKAQLCRALADHGIAYHHEPRLGSPKPLRDTYRATGDLAAFIAGFREYLSGQDRTLREYAAVMRGDRVCLLCFEREAELCHRSVVAEALTSLTATAPVHL